jgi:isopropylmalate/homocitrate/citramalate synthase
LGYRIPANKPIVGDNVLQTAGIHADGDNKTICILMIYFPNALAENANTL